MKISKIALTIAIAVSIQSIQAQFCQGIKDGGVSATMK